MTIKCAWQLACNVLTSLCMSEKMCPSVIMHVLPSAEYSWSGTGSEHAAIIAVVWFVLLSRGQLAMLGTLEENFIIQA